MKYIVLLLFTACQYQCNAGLFSCICGGDEGLEVDVSIKRGNCKLRVEHLLYYNSKCIKVTSKDKKRRIERIKDKDQVIWEASKGDTLDSLKIIKPLSECKYKLLKTYRTIVNSDGIPKYKCLPYLFLNGKWIQLEVQTVPHIYECMEKNIPLVEEDVHELNYKALARQAQRSMRRRMNRERLLRTRSEGTISECDYEEDDEDEGYDGRSFDYSTS